MSELPVSHWNELIQKTGVHRTRHIIIQIDSFLYRSNAKEQLHLSLINHFLSFHRFSILSSFIQFCHLNLHVNKLFLNTAELTICNYDFDLLEATSEQILPWGISRRCWIVFRTASVLVEQICFDTVVAKGITFNKDNVCTKTYIFLVVKNEVRDR